MESNFSHTVPEACSVVKPTIALVDDESNILTSVSMALEKEGFEVRKFSDSVKALRDLTQKPADLAVLDIKMPGLDGMDLLSQLPKGTPAIFLTSKDEDVDEELGFKLGADDYIRKPFNMRLLIGRIRAVLKRVAAASRYEKASDRPVVQGNLVLDRARYKCTWLGKEVSGLTITEFKILMSLALRPGYIKNRQQLIDSAYGENINVLDRTIDSHIKRMRKRFKTIDPSFSCIKTRYSGGYYYEQSS